MKKPTLAPPYVTIYPILAELVNKHGYALTVHGSVSRDFDLLAVPWVETGVSKPYELLKAIYDYWHMDINDLNCYDSGGRNLLMPVIKPHNRLAFIIPLKFAGAAIDLSIILTDEHRKLHENNTWEDLVYDTFEEITSIVTPVSKG